MADIIETASNNEQNEKLEKLFQAARNARGTADSATAIKHYEEISAICPNSWEAMFYLVILKTKRIKNQEIASAAIMVQDCLQKVFELIKNTIDDKQAQRDAISEVLNQCRETALSLTIGSENFYKSITNVAKNVALGGLYCAAGSLDETRKARFESRKRSIEIGGIFISCYTAIGIFNDDELYNTVMAWALESVLCLHFRHIQFCNTEVYDYNAIMVFATELRKVKPSYVLPNIRATGNRNYALLVLAFIGIGLVIGCLTVAFIYR